MRKFNQSAYRKKLYRAVCLMIFLLCLFSNSQAISQASYEDATRSSQIIGKWLSRATSQFDFVSATPVSIKRAGDKFFIIDKPAMKFGSDYGFSYIKVPLGADVLKAYQTIGFNTSTMQSSIDLTRFHVNLGFANKHDFNLSYLRSVDGVTGWGLGYKRVLYHMGFFFVSYRSQFAMAKKPDFFENTSITNDLSASLYFRVIDIFGGVKHSYGRVKFNSSNPKLQLPTVKLFSALTELETFYGIVLATTTNTRLTIQANELAEERAFAAKFSFHFDTLLPTLNNLFRDPRYIKE